ncbi:hypothetical protein Kisp01_26060 [Kineosporia sp. NBRC 101677]|nr:hypothetical protein Kisp01_26060 [Kineosporia sp. NBRC 101677]
MSGKGIEGGVGIISPAVQYQNNWQPVRFVIGRSSPPVRNRLSARAGVKRLKFGFRSPDPGQDTTQVAGHPGAGDHGTGGGGQEQSARDMAAGSHIQAPERLSL